MFIRDMLGPDTYFYMGGNSWGVGIDYELDFKPDFSGAPFWLTACTSRVYGLQWTKDSFSAELRGLLRDDCEIVLHVEARSQPSGCRWMEWSDRLPSGMIRGAVS